MTQAKITDPARSPDTVHELVGHPVAFLQNAWVQEPDRLRASFSERDEAYRLAMLRRLLFRGCVTGRRLRDAFGEWCDAIVWEECTREVAGDSRTILPAQPHHIVDVIARFAPPVVIAFGRHAQAAVRPLCNVPLICAPHPAARQATVPQALMAAAFAAMKYMPNGGISGQRAAGGSNAKG